MVLIKFIAASENLKLFCVGNKQVALCCVIFHIFILKA